MSTALQNPNITVIIPTRDRGSVLASSLKTISSQDYGNLRIVVSDNCSQDNTEEIVRNFDDPRIEYFKTSTRLSMSKNWEFAIDKVNDGFVTIVGDDDGLLPNALNRVATLIRNTSCLAIGSRLCYYTWPTTDANEGARLTVPLGRGIKVRKSKPWLSKVMRGEASYIDLPMLYNGGFIDFSLLQTIRSKRKFFYHSCIPDVYSAVAIASSTDEYIFSEEPFSISGASPFSTGNSHFERKVGVDSPIRKFLSENNIPFHDEIPLNEDGTYPASLHSIVYESYLQSSFLRPGPSHCITHAQQLEIILAKAVSSDPRVLGWAPIFANAHNLDMITATRKARGLRASMALRRTSDRLVTALNTYVLTTNRPPLENVYMASVCAGEIIKKRPTEIDRFGQLTSRMWKKFFGQ